MERERQMEEAMANCDPRRPNRPMYSGFGGGWIIVVILILLIIGFGRGGWFGGYWRGQPVAPAHTTANANGAHNTNTNANNNAAPAPAHNKP